jgi:hypothetical protein
MRTLFALLAALAVVACATPKHSYVSAAVPRGNYIDATLSVESGDWRFLFPQNEACAKVIRLEAPVEYRIGGPFGRAIAPDGTVCEPIGIGSLRRWRARQPRQEGDMAPSSAATWKVIHKDAQTYLLRGRFPVASRLGLTNTFDVVVLVANDGGTCSTVAESGNATLVFRTAGSRVLDLGACPVQAIAQPL